MSPDPDGYGKSRNVYIFRGANTRRSVDEFKASHGRGYSLRTLDVALGIFRIS